MVIRSFLTFLILIGIGFVLGVSQASTVASLLPGIHIAANTCTTENVVRCADEVSTAGWQTYRNINQGIAFQYPADFSLSGSGDTIMMTDGSGDTIQMTKLRDTLKKQTNDTMSQASWKIADRRVYALTSPYTTNTDGTLTSTYLFVRDFPFDGPDGRYAMFKAVVTLRDANMETAVARAHKIMDPETVLNLPEQILSTFRFLEFDEMNIKNMSE